MRATRWQDNSEKFAHTESDDCFVESIDIETGVIINVFNIASDNQRAVNEIINQNTQRPPVILSVHRCRCRKIADTIGQITGQMPLVTEQVFVLATNRVSSG